MREQGKSRRSRLITTVRITYPAGGTRPEEGDFSETACTTGVSNCRAVSAESTAAGHRAE